MYLKILKLFSNQMLKIYIVQTIYNQLRSEIAISIWEKCERKPTVNTETFDTIIDILF